MAKPKYKLSDTRNIGIMAHIDAGIPFPELHRHLLVAAPILVIHAYFFYLYL